MMMLYRLLTLSLALIFTAETYASDHIAWNGFASFYGRKALTDTRELSLNGRHLDFSNTTRVGLNIRSDFAKNFAAVGQLVATKRQAANEPPQWSPEFDWFFLSYSPSDQIELRAGRQLFPGSIIGEYMDVGVTYPWRQLPVQYFASVQFKSFEGASVSYSQNYGEYSFKALVFGGSSRPSVNATTDLTYEFRDLKGARLNFTGDDWGVQGLVTHYNFIGTDPATKTITLVTPKPSLMTSVGGYFDNRQWLFYAEYYNTDASDNGEVSSLHAHYVTLGRYIRDWLPHYTYSHGAIQLDGIIGIPPLGREKLESHTLGLNYQASPALVVKSEFIWQHGEGNGGYLMSGPGAARSAALGFDIVF